jgi:DNA-binding GntR family transcriptional regulator
MTGQTQGQIVYGFLLEEIRSGLLQPGARLRETEISDRLSTSRTPVREAIRMLESDGLVVHVPHTGAVVRSLDYAEIIELYEIRSVLEGTAAKLAARHASEIEIAELQRINDEMHEVANDSVALAKANKLFHSRLLASARNRYLAKSMAALKRTLFILGPTTLADETRAAEACHEHDEILAAIAQHDLQLAEVKMRLHIDMSLKSRLGSFVQTDEISMVRDETEMDHGEDI